VVLGTALAEKNVSLRWVLSAMSLHSNSNNSSSSDSLDTDLKGFQKAATAIALQEREAEEKRGTCMATSWP